jgi:hypothetical protein
MIFSLKEYLFSEREIYKNQPGLLIGSAPSAKQLKNFKVGTIRIGIGDMPWRAPKFGPYDFWVASNGYYPLPHNRRDSLHISKYCKNLVFSGSCLQRSIWAEKDVAKIVELQKNANYIVFDERHFAGQYCNPEKNCCYFSKRFDNLPAIQELIQDKSSINFSEIATSSTVGTYGLSLAILLGLNPIFISGIELPRNLKDYKWYKNWKTPIPLHFFRNYILRIRKPLKANDFGEGFDQTIEAFTQIVKAANSLGIKIYCMSKTSALLAVPGITCISVEEAMGLLDN